MKKLVDYKNLIWEKIFPEEGPSKESLFNIILLGCIILGLLKVIIAVASGFTLKNIIITSSDFISLLLIYYLSNKYNKHRLGSYLVAILVNFVFFPLLFYANGAVAGGASSYFILGIAFTILSIDGKSMYILVSLELIFYAVLYKFALWHPELIDALEWPNQTFQSSYLFMAVAAVLIVVTIKVSLSEYQKKSKKVRNLLNQVQELSVKDPLTGIFNRRYMIEFLDMKIDQSKSDNIPLSIIMFDIDNFKILNDTYGHVVGDEVLQKVSAIFLEECRKDDIVARYGGEEFLVVLPYTDIETAFKRAEQMRVSVSEKIEIKNCNHQITISGGVVQFENTYDIMEYIKKVDEKLYLAKANGRNMVIK